MITPYTCLALNQPAFIPPPVLFNSRGCSGFQSSFPGNWLRSSQENHHIGRIAALSFEGPCMPFSSSFQMSDHDFDTFRQPPQAFKRLAFIRPFVIQEDTLDSIRKNNQDNTQDNEYFISKLQTENKNSDNTNDDLPYCLQDTDSLPHTEKEHHLAEWLKEIQQLSSAKRKLLLKTFSVEQLSEFHKNDRAWNTVTKQIAREFNWNEFVLNNIEDDPHHKKALGLALLSKIAYACIDTTHSMESCFPLWCDTLLESGFKIKSFGFKDDCSRGLIFYRGKDVIISFRGSSKFQDFLLDLDACHISSYGGNVHKGMKLAFDKVRSNLMSLLDDIESESNEPLHIALTGHSMGGAFAYFAACELADETGYDIKKVVSFGAPKVFDQGAADFYQSAGLEDKTARFEHFSDLVPFLPPVPKLFYQSIGNQHYLSKNNEIWIKPPSYKVQADQLKRFSLKEQEAFGFEARTILDHSLDSYIKGLYIYQA